MCSESFSQPGEQGGQGGQGGPSQPWQGYFNILSYRPYFDVDTIDVTDRIKDSLVVNADFIEKTSHNPDM